MDESLIYSKTPKGVAEVRNRSGRLPPLMRRILIMINGRTELAELAPAAPAGQLDAIVAALEDDGLIEVTEIVTTALPYTTGLATVRSLDFDIDVEDRSVASRRTEPMFNLPLALQPAPAVPRRAGAGAAAPPAAASAVASVAAPGTALPADFEERKARAVRELFNLLGPYGEAAAATIRSSNSPTELHAAIRHAGTRITIFRGGAAGSDFVRAHGVTERRPES